MQKTAEGRVHLMPPEMHSALSIEMHSALSIL